MKKGKKTMLTKETAQRVLPKLFQQFYDGDLKKGDLTIKLRALGFSSVVSSTAQTYIETRTRTKAEVLAYLLARLPAGGTVSP
jgi:hypothetical protein